MVECKYKFWQILFIPQTPYQTNKNGPNSYMSCILSTWHLKKHTVSDPDIEPFILQVWATFQFKVHTQLRSLAMRTCAHVVTILLVALERCTIGEREMSFSKLETQWEGEQRMGHLETEMAPCFSNTCVIISIFNASYLQWLCPTLAFSTVGHSMKRNNFREFPKLAGTRFDNKSQQTPVRNIRIRRWQETQW